MTAMIFLGYTLTLLQYCVYCFSRFLKEKKNMVIVDLLSKVISALACLCLGSMSGFYSLLLGGAVLILSYLKQRMNKNWHPLFFILAIIYIVLLVMKFEGISSIIIFITNMISIINNWYMPPQLMRIMGTLSALTFMCFQISIKNYLGLLELIVIISNVVSYIKYKKINLIEKNEMMKRKI